jgi:hypothetical protein
LFKEVSGENRSFPGRLLFAIHPSHIHDLAVERLKQFLYGRMALGHLAQLLFLTPRFILL